MELANIFGHSILELEERGTSMGSICPEYDYITWVKMSEMHSSSVIGTVAGKFYVMTRTSANLAHLNWLA